MASDHLDLRLDRQLANKVYEAIEALNGATYAAALEGLHIEIHVSEEEEQGEGTAPWPMVTAHIERRISYGEEPAD